MESSNQNESLDQKWFYSSAGNKIGPVLIDEIKSKYKQGVINDETLVWRNGFLDWKKVKETEIFEQPVILAPPPLIGNAVNNTFVWMLSIVPVIGAIVLTYYKANYNDTSYFAEVIFFMILNSLFSALDESKLRKAGYDSHNIFWAIILVPVYLWKRSNITKQSKYYFWVWFIALFLSVAIEATNESSTKTEDYSTNNPNEQIQNQTNDEISSDQEMNYSVEDQKTIEKIKAKVKRDFPNEFTVQKSIYDQEVECYFYMKTVTDITIKQQVERDFPLEFTVQKELYNQEVEAKEQMK
jgi:hypothetical protein